MFKWIRAFILTAFSKQFIKPTIIVIIVLIITMYVFSNNSDKPANQADNKSKSVIVNTSPIVNTYSFKVAWKTGIIMGLIVPSTTTNKQLTDFIYKFRQARKENKLSELIPPVNLGLSDKYANFIILIFNDAKWATLEEYNKYEKSGMDSNTAKSYVNHIVASYQYELDGKEYGALGYDEGWLKSRHYRKLF